MTVSTLNNRVSYAGNGVTTVFSFPNRFLLDADLVVVEVNDTTDVETTKTLTTHYTVSGAGDAAGGSVTMLVAPATGVTLVIYRDPALTQPIDLVNGDDLDVDAGIERGLDRSTLQIQRLKDLITRSARLSDGDTSGASVTLPTPVANRLLGWNATAMGIENKVPTDLALYTVSAFVATLLDDSTGAQLTESLRTDLAELAAQPADDDEVILRDTSATGGKRNTVANLIKAILDTARTFTAGHTFTPAQYFTAGLGPGYVQNYSLSGAVAANALTMTMAGYDGTALSATNKSQFTFRSATASVGTTSVVSQTANLTLDISSGSTLGATSAVPFRLWWAIVNDAGTLRLAVQNCSTATAVYAIGDDVLISSTAEGGAGAADSAGVWYTGTAVTSKPARILGYTEHSLTTAGTWDEAPDKIQLWQPGMKLPGDVVQRVCASKTDVFTTGSATYVDVTGMSVTLTPTSAANRIRISGMGTTGHTLSTESGFFILLRGATQIAMGDAAGSRVQALITHYEGLTVHDNVSFHWLDSPAAVVATTYKLQARVTAGTVSWGSSGTDTNNGNYGRCPSFMEAQEIMG